jgi:hypothetical protein
MTQFTKQEIDGVIVHTNSNYNEIVEKASTEISEEHILTDAEIAGVETDITNHNARQYLSSTDWYITRQAETGVVVPTDILTKRAEARAAVVSVA